MEFFKCSLLTLLLAFAVNNPLQAQVPSSLVVNLEWDESPADINIGTISAKIWQFKGGVYIDNRTLPYYSKRIALPNHGKLDASFFSKKSSPLDPMGVEINIDNTTPTIKVTYETERHQYFARVYVFPVYKDGGSYSKLDQFRIRLAYVQTPRPTAHRYTPTKKSKLRNGDIYKFSISKNGIHKITASFLEELGIDLGSINPKNIQLLGNGGARIPELIATDRIDDLAENAIFISGENDGVFNTEDFILFNATGPKPVIDAGDNTYRIDNNPYTDKTYYFIKLNKTPGIRVQNQASLTSAAFSTTDFIDYQRHELDKVNLLDIDPSTEGGGNEWFGEFFKVEKTKTFNDLFHFPNILTDKKATIRVRFAAKSKKHTSMSVTIDNKSFQGSFQALNGGTWADVAHVTTASATYFPKGSTPSISLTYNSANISDAEGRLDYIEINASSALKYENQPLYFGSLSKDPHTSTTFKLSKNTNDDVLIWDITKGTLPAIQNNTQTSSSLEFSLSTETLKRFVAFRINDDFPTPTVVGKINNQNIHGIERADLIVVYHPSLQAEAEKLALHRATNDDMEVVLVDINDLYNEFSSGALDASAIRDFSKMVYDRDPQFRYLLLMGDGSYDHKNIHNRDPYYNLIPVRETQKSVDKIDTYPTDDYFGLLSDDEGKVGPNGLVGAIDIAVGRITAETPEIADAIVEKIIYYDTSPNTLKPWRTQLLCIGDDGDSNIHMRQTNETADKTESDHPIFTAEKILFDAFPQVPAPYGERFPEAAKRINEAVLNGSLVINYFGHGGANGLAQERVITLQSITKWSNIKDRLPLMITASCSTAGFDDPAIKTFGEELLKNPTGGAIALFSTVRPVYASHNEALIDAAYPQIFIRDNGKRRAVGEILRVGKNKAGEGHRVRKFLLLGDPSMPIAIPDNNLIITDKINGIDPSTVDSVGIQALTKVTIAGHIANSQNQLINDFSGRIYIKIFDKINNLKTLGQDTSPFSYTAPKGIIFKGNATVTNGKFEFSFVVPKDVVSRGYGKIKYYASDLVSRDAAGSESKIYIGGIGGDVIVDDTPPEIELFMNDENFVDGGITNNHPTIFAKISDDNGINISGSGIGHDLTAKVDTEIKIANNYYETNADDYSNGELRYPLEDLAIGEHTITVKAWDVANNSATAKTTFVVADSEGAALAHVLNYPNPFTDNTSFQFEHNISGLAQVRIDIYSVDGKIIKSIDQDINSEGFRVTDITWDGKDEYGDQLARGVYIYRVILTSLEEKGQATSGFEKLVIMK